MRIFLDEEQAQITTVPQNLLHITLSNGQTWDNVEARRLFPMNDPWHYISLLNEENEEVAMIRDVQALPPASRDAVMHVLGEYYMFPVITNGLSSLLSTMASPKSIVCPAEKEESPFPCLPIVEISVLKSVTHMPTSKHCAAIESFCAIPMTTAMRSQT